MAGREVLGFDVGDGETEAFWTSLLYSLKTRGLGVVTRVISDAHTGLKKAIDTAFQGARWPTLLGAPEAQHSLDRATCESGDGRERDPHHLRPARRDARSGPTRRSHPDAQTLPPESRPDAPRRPRRPTRVLRVPAQTLAADLVQEPERLNRKTKGRNDVGGVFRQPRGPAFSSSNTASGRPPLAATSPRDLCGNWRP